MMWNWLVTALASEATIVLYDGSPFHPGPERLFELVEQSRLTLFGVSAKYIDAVRKSGHTPGKAHDLSSMRTMTSTGSPLAPESFDFVYESIHPDVHLASISGGTDIVSCFVGGNPMLPGWRGEIQCAALGMDVLSSTSEVSRRAMRANSSAGAPFRPWRSGTIPTIEVSRSLLRRFPGVWCHGDWIRETEHGGFVIYGRSDATLNPGGVELAQPKSTGRSTVSGSP
jgi:acetoacetyl-CoA synthetase